MPEAFKVDVTPEKGKDKVEINEARMMQENINTRITDKDYIQKAITELRETVLDLNKRIKEAQGVLGTTIGGLDDSEIKQLAEKVEGRLNELGEDFAKEAAKLTIGGKGDKFDKEIYDINKSELIYELITSPLQKYINYELAKVIENINSGNKGAEEEGKLIKAVREAQERNKRLDSIALGPK